MGADKTWNSTYIEKLRDPRWQKKRLDILQRDNWTCTECGDKKSTLHVHHLFYADTPWMVPDFALRTLCKDCHSSACHISIRANQEGIDQYFWSLLVLGDVLRRHGFDSGSILNLAFKMSDQEDFDLAMAALPSVPPPPSAEELEQIKREADGGQ